MNYDVIIIGAGPGGIFAAYELMKKKPECKIAVFEEGIRLKRENVRLTGKKLRAVSIVNDVRSCAASGEQEHFPDGKYNITNDFGGNIVRIYREETGSRTDEVCR